MSTNKFSKYVVENIVTGTQIRSIVPAGALDSAAVIDLIDSDYVAARTPSANGFDSADVIGIVDSDYVQARVTLDGVGIDSATAQSIANSEILSTVDAAYVQARETPQDFAYSSLTGAPTALSSFTNDTNYITAADIPATVDSDYVAARTPASNGAGLDSAATLDLLSYGIQNVGSNQKQVAISLNTFVDPFDQTGTAERSFNLNYTSTTGMFVRETGGRTEIHADASGTGQSTGLLLTGASFGNNGTEIAGNLKLSSLPTSDPSETGLLWNDGGIPVFSGSTAPTGGGGLDSAAVIATMNEEFKILTGSRVEIGNGAVTSGGGGTDFFNIAIGSSASAIGDAGVAIGRLSNIPNNVVNAVAVGIDTEVSANYGVALGDGASVTGTESTAIGPESGATGNASLALGRGAKANANNTIALAATGANSTVATQYGIDIRTSAAGSLTYDTTNDWTFGAAVTAPAFVGDGSGLTGLPSGGGLDSAEVISTINEELKISAGKVEIGQTAIASGNSACIAIGNGAEATGTASYAIGDATASSSNALAIVDNAVASSVYAIAIGQRAEATHINTIALGNEADAKGNYAVAIGDNAAATQVNAVAIGRDATAPSDNSLSIGYGAGNTVGGDGTVLIGTNTGSSTHVRAMSVAIGMNAQLENDASVSGTVAVGYEAGKTRQETSTVAIGYKAGETDQLNSATAVGFQAGNTSQGGSSVAIGRDAAFTGQATNSVAIGRAAGYENQGTRSIAIGRQAGALNQGANNIILNATSGALDRTDQFGIDIRTSAAGSLTYDTTNDWTFGAGVTMTDLTASGATVVFNNLPTVDPVNAGQLWNDGGTLKVSAG
jgi:hypothetical protein